MSKCDILAQPAKDRASEFNYTLVERRFYAKLPPMYSRILSLLFSFMLLGAVAKAANTEPYYAGISPEAEAVFVIDMHSLMASPLVQTIEQMMGQGQPKKDPKALAMGLTEHTGATKDDLGKFVLSTSDVMSLQEMSGQGEPNADELKAANLVMTFQFKKEITKDQFDAWIKSQTPPEEQETTKKTDMGDGVLYTDESEGGALAMGMMPAGGETIIVVGAEDTVKSAMKAGKGSLPKNIAVAQTLLESTPNILVLASPSEQWKEQLAQQAAEGEGNNATYVEDAEQFAFGLNISDGLKLLSGVKFKNAATAKTAYTELNEAVTEMQGAPMEPGNPMAMFGAVVQNMKVTEKGDAISLTTEMGAMESQQMLYMLPMMFMGMQQGGGMGGPGMQPGGMPPQGVSPDGGGM